MFVILTKHHGDAAAARPKVATNLCKVGIISDINVKMERFNRIASRANI